ncbi:BLUF domain-containing protein [Roseibacillus persicicus]|uniref:BLUF domain-containing protein n=1 Tax=Roseibacillus persicicus TaxID=454148 RepID=UPI00398A7788
MIFGIAYTSLALTNFDDKSLQELSQAAAEKNKSLDITGYLYYDNQLFMQYLEGRKEDVEALMTAIKDDPRHRVFVAVPLARIEKRIFPDWSMRYLPDDLPFDEKITLEDELAQIFEMTMENNLHSDEVAEAILNVTQRIATLA